MHRRTACLAATMIAATPWQARAQPAGRPARIAYVWLFSNGPSAPYPEAFAARMRELGWREGRDMITTHHDAKGDPELLTSIARQLVREPVDVILATCTPEARAMRQVTTTIPIVMVATGDPVLAGLVESLARPGTNVTGISTMSLVLSSKRVALLREAFPAVRQATVLWNPQRADNQAEVTTMQAAATRVGMQMRSAQVRTVEELDTQLDAVGWDGTQALLTAGDNLVSSRRKAIVERAAALRMPAIYEDRLLVEAGGLMSFGPDLRRTHARGADYVDRILKGAKPSELPIEQPTRFDLVVDLRVARAQKLDIPRSVLLQADEVLR